MTRTVSRRAGTYVLLAAAGLLAALVLRRPELAAVATPFLLVAALAALWARKPQVDVALTVGRERVLEGDEVEIRADVTSSSDVRRLELRLGLPAGLEHAGEKAEPLRLRAGAPRTVAFRIRCRRWGGYAVEVVDAVADDPLRLVSYSTRFDLRAPLRVYPQPEALRQLVAPAETQVFAGNRVGRQRGEGIEFADLRPFQPGDRVKRINWRASARRPELWVNDFHPERNTDVVLFLDSFAEVQREGRSTRDLALRAAAALAHEYLRRRDRVGFLSFGGFLSWLVPGTGASQAYRILDAAIGTEIAFSYAWGDIRVIPRRILPPKSLVVALTPLVDERAGRALLELRARGFDVAVVEISPEPFLERPRSESERVALGIWRLRRDAVRHAFEHAGVPVGAWGRRAPARGRDRGGEGIPAARAARARLTFGASALALLAGMAVAEAAQAGRLEGLAAGVGLAAGALLLLGLGLRRAPLVASALLALGAEYAVALVGRSAADPRAAGYAAAYLLVRELGDAALEERRFDGLRTAAALCVALAGALLAGALLVVGQAPADGGLAVEAAGVAAAVAAIGAVALLVRRLHG